MRDASDSVHFQAALLNKTDSVCFRVNECIIIARDFNLILDEVLERNSKSSKRHLKVTSVIKVWWETML